MTEGSGIVVTIVLAGFGGGGGESDTLNKVGDSTLYGTEKSEENKEEVEGGVIGGGGDEASIMSVVYPPWDS